MTPHKRPAAGGHEQAGPTPRTLPAPPPGPITWLRHTLTARQHHQCQCSHVRLAHLHLKWAECLYCDCGGFVRRRQR